MSKEVGRTILDPCARPGGEGDWWQEQHQYCTGSHSLNGEGHIACDCECHKSAAVVQTRVTAAPEIEALRAEVGRYKAALERIALERIPHPTFCRESYLRDIAKAALTVDEARDSIAFVRGIPV